MTNLTPSQKRSLTMEKKYGADWRSVIGKKAAETTRKRFTPEEISERNSRAGKIGGKNSPTKFTPGDPRAVRYGKLKKPRAQSRSEKSDK